MKNLLIFCVLILLGACSTTKEESTKVASSSEGHWTLDFFYFYNSKQINRESFHYDTRRDCFDAMYQMQVDARKQPKHSGSGVCAKYFPEGQE